MKSIKLSDSDIARGKAILKAEILDTADSEALLLENLQQQAITKGQVVSTASLVANVEKISASNVKSVCTSGGVIFKRFVTFYFNDNFFQVADKLAKGKLSMAAVGNLKTVPYVDELK